MVLSVGSEQPPSSLNSCADCEFRTRCVSAGATGYRQGCCTFRGPPNIKAIAATQYGLRLEAKRDRAAAEPPPARRATFSCVSMIDSSSCTGICDCGSGLA